MHRFIRIFSIVICLMIGLSATACNRSAEVAQEQMKSKKEVITTLFPQYDFVREIVKDKMNVRLLLPPGVESHAFEPTPQDIAQISKADVFIYTGESMEPWAQKIIAATKGNNLSVVDASQGIDLMEEAEEHTEEASGHSHEGENPWEWAGAFELKKGEVFLSFAKKEAKYAEVNMKLLIVQTDEKAEKALEIAQKQANSVWKGSFAEKKAGESLEATNSMLQLQFDASKEKTVYPLKVEKDATYVILMEHMPSEFEAGEHYLKDAKGNDIEAVAMHPEEAHDHAHGGKDPHIWLDPVLAKKMVDNILRELIQKDTPHAEFYTANAMTLKNNLDALDKKVLDTFQNLKSKTIVYGGHFAFGYFAKRYGLTHISPYAGFAPNAEPTPKKIAELMKVLQNSGSKAIYYEENIDPKVAKVIAEGTGAKMLLLHGAHNVSKDELTQGQTYLKIMEGNLERLKEGLGHGQ